jgi:alanine racemase
MDVSASLGQPTALISRTALLHNVKVLRRALAPQVKLCAMVKADAYGHGAALVADALTNYCAEQLEAPAADFLAVVTLDEAFSLGPTTVPILILRPLEHLYIWQQKDRIESAVLNGWTLTVGTPEAASDVARIAMARDTRCDLQVMLDTGVAREGIAPEALDKLIAAIESYPSLRLTGLCTHFASSEEAANPLNADQLRRFRAVTEAHATRNPKLLRHAANSGAIFFAPRSHLDMVRPGIGLYGIDPTCRPSVDRALRPVLKITAPLLQARPVRKGTTAGYNQTWTADRDTRLGLVPIGYADGYLRSFSNRAKMLVRGKAAPVVGRVSMDYTTIDLGGVPDAQVGDEVIIVDNDPLSPASVYALAEWAGTIPYEIFCHVGGRVKRLAVEPQDAQEKLWATGDSTSAAKSA